MRGLKIYLTIVTVLLLIAIGFGVYVWRVLQSLSGESEIQTANELTTEATDASVRDETQKSNSDTPIVIDPATLSEKQRAVLDSFGYGDAKITISRETVSCAQKTLGEARFTEILNGNAPTPIEAMRLLPCMKQ